MSIHRRFNRQRIDRQVREDRDRIHQAESEVLAYLSRRWKHRLGGHRLTRDNPEVQKMVRAPAFRGLVEKRLRGEPFVDVDLDHAPDVEQAPDGTVTDRMVDETGGGDPAAYRCPDCGDPVSEPGATCEPCRTHFRRTS